MFHTSNKVTPIEEGDHGNREGDAIRNMDYDTDLIEEDINISPREGIDTNVKLGKYSRKKTENVRYHNSESISWNNEGSLVHRIDQVKSPHTPRQIKNRLKTDEGSEDDIHDCILHDTNSSDEIQSSPVINDVDEDDELWDQTVKISQEFPGAIIEHNSRPPSRSSIIEDVKSLAEEAGITNMDSNFGRSLRNSFAPKSPTQFIGKLYSNIFATAKSVEKSAEFKPRQLVRVDTGYKFEDTIDHRPPLLFRVCFLLVPTIILIVFCAGGIAAIIGGTLLLNDATVRKRSINSFNEIVENWNRLENPMPGLNDSVVTNSIQPFTDECSNMATDTNYGIDSDQNSLKTFDNHCLQSKKTYSNALFEESANSFHVTFFDETTTNFEISANRFQTTSMYTSQKKCEDEGGIYEFESSGLHCKFYRVLSAVCLLLDEIDGNILVDSLGDPKGCYNEGQFNSAVYIKTSSPLIRFNQTIRIEVRSGSDPDLNTLSLGGNPTGSYIIGIILLILGPLFLIALTCFYACFCWLFGGGMIFGIHHDDDEDDDAEIDNDDEKNIEEQEIE